MLCDMCHTVMTHKACLGKPCSQCQWSVSALGGLGEWLLEKVSGFCVSQICFLFSLNHIRLLEKSAFFGQRALI